MGIVEAALAAGATQLGEEPHPHFILDAEQLARFVTLLGVGERPRELPPLPY